MKKLFLGALLALACLQPAGAQEPNKCERPSMDPTRMVERLDKRLQLTDKQEKEITALLKEFYTDYRCNPKATRTECQKERSEVDKKILKLLNKEQQKEYKNMIERRRNGAKNNHPHRGHRHNCPHDRC